MNLKRIRDASLKGQKKNQEEKIKNLVIKKCVDKAEALSKKLLDEEFKGDKDKVKYEIERLSKVKCRLEKDKASYERYLTEINAELKRRNL